jgi:hypothetical protein
VSTNVVDGGNAQESPSSKRASPGGNRSKSLAFVDAWFFAPAVGTGWTFPIFAATFTIAAKVGWQLPWFEVRSNNNEVISGLVEAAIAWLVVTIVFLPMTTARRANANSFLELTTRLAAVRYLLPEGKDTSIDTQIQELEGLLNEAGSSWVLGYAYIDAWRRLHSIEEAVIGTTVFDRSHLARAVLDAEQRVDGSGMAANLSKTLKCVADYLKVGCIDVVTTSSATVHLDPPKDDAEARQLLIGVVHTVNDYRDESWKGLVRLKNLTMAALVLTELFGYGILLLAIVSGALIDPILAAVAYFLVAATVGLFSRLNSLGQSDTAIDDYGLSYVRLVLVPIFSGLAGVGGVFLTALLFSSGATSLLQPGGSASAARAAAALPELPSIFSLTLNPAGLLFALVFGFTPALLLSSLQDVAGKYKLAISNTELSTPIIKPT